jgi:hypothetical protein
MLWDFFIFYFLLKLFFQKRLRNFYWSDNWQFSYSNWANEFNSNLQDQDACGIIKFRSVYWSTANCDDLNDFICKISKETPPIFKAQLAEKSNTALIICIVFSIITLTIFFIALKNKIKIHAYLSSIFSRNNWNGYSLFKRHKDSESLSFGNKNFQQ